MADYHIKHITRYTYASTVIDCSNQIMLYPLNDSLQIVKSHEIKITNDPAVEVFNDLATEGRPLGLFDSPIIQQIIARPIKIHLELS